jgi:hypothetical protein
MVFGAPYCAVKLHKGSETWITVSFLFQLEGEVLKYQNHGEEVLQRELQDPLTLAAKTSNPDTFHYWTAMKQPDRTEFIKAMKEEVNAQLENGHWELLPCSAVPRGTKVLDAMWAFRRKC